MYHSLLIHSSADGHLGCFHVLFTLVFNAWLSLGNMEEEVYLSLFNNMYMVYILKENTYKEVKVAKVDHEPYIKKHPSNKSNSKGGNIISG